MDIRATLPPETTLAELEQFAKATGNRFTDVKQRLSWRANISFTEGDAKLDVPTKGTPDGFILASPAENLAAQVRLDGFTLSKLKPYDRWATLRPEAQALWKHYVEIAKPILATRLAIRTINRIELPGPGVELKDYILTIPEIAPAVPQTLNTFFMRLVVPGPQGTAIITETIEPPGRSLCSFSIDF